MIVNTPVRPYINPPYRGKLVESGGLREPEDWSYVMEHYRNEGKHLVVHDLDLSDNVILEVHNEYSKNGEEEIENCTCEYFPLDRDQRHQLAIYLLSTI